MAFGAAETDTVVEAPSALRRAPARDARGQAGLTLPELVLTLVVLGILLALAIPRIDNGLRRVRLQSASAELSTAHFLARTSAMRYGRPAQLHIDAANGNFWVQVDTSISAGTLDTVGSIHRMSSAGITITSTRAILCFDRRGLAYTAGNCEAPDATITFSLAGRTDTVRTTAIGKIIR
jgi:prepilin-type N-terminal cleavage/methylation domain-containing protein